MHSHVGAMSGRQRTITAAPLEEDGSIQHIDTTYDIFSMSTVVTKPVGEHSEACQKPDDQRTCSRRTFQTDPTS